jgi:hypothetical protein
MNTTTTKQGVEKMKITDNERHLLRAIRDSDFNQGCNPVNNWVWADCINDNLGTGHGGVMASLVKKGLADHDYYNDPGSQHSNDNTVCITRAGFDAI